MRALRFIYLWFDVQSRAIGGQFGGLAALHLAARRGYPHVVTTLLVNRASVDQEDVRSFSYFS